MLDDTKQTTGLTAIHLASLAHSLDIDIVVAISLLGTSRSLKGMLVAHTGMFTPWRQGSGTTFTYSRRIITWPGGARRVDHLIICPHPRNSRPALDIWTGHNRKHAACQTIAVAGEARARSWCTRTRILQVRRLRDRPNLHLSFSLRVLNDRSQGIAWSLRTQHTRRRSAPTRTSTSPTS